MVLTMILTMIKMIFMIAMILESYGVAMHHGNHENHFNHGR